MKPLTYALALLAALAWLLVLAPAAPAAAHNAYPARTYNLQLGPYACQVLLYNEKVNAGDHVQMVIIPDAATKANAVSRTGGNPPTFAAAAMGPNGQSVPARLYPDENDHTNLAVDLVIPAPGQWEVQVSAGSQDARFVGQFALPVAAAPGIPQWAGWAIALSPLLGVAWFAVQQQRIVRRAAAAGLVV